MEIHHFRISNHFPEFKNSGARQGAEGSQGKSDPKVVVRQPGGPGGLASVLTKTVSDG